MGLTSPLSDRYDQRHEGGEQGETTLIYSDYSPSAPEVDWVEAAFTAPAPIQPYLAEVT